MFVVMTSGTVNEDEEGNAEVDPSSLVECNLDSVDLKDDGQQSKSSGNLDISGELAA